MIKIIKWLYNINEHIELLNTICTIGIKVLIVATIEKVLFTNQFLLIDKTSTPWLIKGLFIWYIIYPIFNKYIREFFWLLQSKDKDKLQHRVIKRGKENE